MNKISYVIPYHLANSLFDIENEIVNRDNFAYSHFVLKNIFGQKNYNLSTYDINHIDDADIIIYNDMPKKLPESNEIYKSYLIIFESELIKPDNWDLDKHKYFNKIFTWNDQFVDNTKYFKINFSHLFPNQINKNLAKKKNLCTLIAGNKSVSHPQELYSKRIEAIHWFEQHQPTEFEFYGVGWSEFTLQNKYANFVFKKLKLSWLFKNSYPSYLGSVVSKKEVLERYKFAICYENAKDIPGYITEKIFDCFFAGCVPIYWGADNINQHIPQECFIDKREFNSYQALYDYIVSMPTQVYMGYLNAIEHFMKSSKADPYRAETFAQTIVDTILKDFNAQ
jgi:alpha(1,3/1,4) fucosyltransferase